ncbi:hypothetical protein RJT34_26213 [Clitoria ternatea]|uniref:Uncharacterized protein n=1 Tax=Clitoria ternatea TaxID=43366 RepID=A0AAN9IFL5_CLITE
MLDTVLDFFTQAASSSAFIFCFCNLIIVIILLDLRPSLSVHQESGIPLSMVVNQKQGKNFNKGLVEKGTAIEVPKVEEVVELEAVDSIEIEGNIDECCSNEEEEKEEKVEKEEDDELRRRVEEFIEKVNKGWKEELLT